MLIGPLIRKIARACLATASTFLTHWYPGHLGNSEQSPLHRLNPNTMLTNTIKEAIWIKLFLSLMSLPSPIPFPIYCDNQSTCTIANTDVISSRTKHINVCHHFIWQHLNDSSFITTWIPGSDMTADILTKPLLSTLFLHHRENLGLVTP